MKNLLYLYDSLNDNKLLDKTCINSAIIQLYFDINTFDILLDVIKSDSTTLLHKKMAVLGFGPLIRNFPSEFKRNKLIFEHLLVLLRDQRDDFIRNNILYYVRYLCFNECFSDILFNFICSSEFKSECNLPLLLQLMSSLFRESDSDEYKDCIYNEFRSLDVQINDCVYVLDLYLLFYNHFEYEVFGFQTIFNCLDNLISINFNNQRNLVYIKNFVFELYNNAFSDDLLKESANSFLVKCIEKSMINSEIISIIDATIDYLANEDEDFELDERVIIQLIDMYIDNSNSDSDFMFFDIDKDSKFSLVGNVLKKSHSGQLKIRGYIDELLSSRFEQHCYITGLCLISDGTVFEKPIEYVSIINAFVQVSFNYIYPELLSSIASSFIYKLDYLIKNELLYDALETVILVLHSSLSVEFLHVLLEILRNIKVSQDIFSFVAQLYIDNSNDINLLPLIYRCIGEAMALEIEISNDFLRSLLDHSILSFNYIDFDLSSSLFLLQRICSKLTHDTFCEYLPNIMEVCSSCLGNSYFYAGAIDLYTEIFRTNIHSFNIEDVKEVLSISLREASVVLKLDIDMDALSNESEIEDFSHNFSNISSAIRSTAFILAQLYNRMELSLGEYLVKLLDVLNVQFNLPSSEVLDSCIYAARLLIHPDSYSFFLTFIEKCIEKSGDGKTVSKCIDIFTYIIENQITTHELLVDVYPIVKRSLDKVLSDFLMVRESIDDMKNSAYILISKICSKEIGIKFFNDLREYVIYPDKSFNQIFHTNIVESNGEQYLTNLYSTIS